MLKFDCILIDEKWKQMCLASKCNENEKRKKKKEARLTKTKRRKNKTEKDFRQITKKKREKEYESVTCPIRHGFL